MIQTTYSNIKAFLLARNLSPQTWVDGDNIWICGIDGPLSLACQIPNDQSNADKLDFDTTFAGKTNRPIKQIDSVGNPIQRPTPFASKIVEGHKIFRRKHGSEMVEVLSGETKVIEFSVPYSKAKIDKVEIVGCGLGDSVSLKVKDTPQGTISGVPNYLLNQFGFDVLLSDGHFEDKSEYDADLIQGLVLVIEYKNNGQNPRMVGCNFTLHQMVPV